MLSFPAHEHTKYTWDSASECFTRSRTSMLLSNGLAGDAGTGNSESLGFFTTAEESAGSVRTEALLFADGERGACRVIA